MPPNKKQNTVGIMNQSIINICNLALTRMGGSQIKSLNSLEEPSEEARACKRLYPQLLKDLLRQHPFGFACATQPLALLKAHTNLTLPYEYAYPAGALKVWRVGMAAHMHSPAMPSASFTLGHGETGTVILCNLPEAFVYYSVYIDDPNRFDPLFVEALAWSLASELALSLRNDINAASALSERAALALAEARGEDAKEQHWRAPDPYFITGRA